VTFESLLLQLLPALEHAGMPYMLTGSVASSAYGVPRSTLDLDIVIQPTREQLIALIKHFPSADYYADEQQALQALEKRSQFNVIDHATGWKVDFIIAEDSEYGHTALARRQVIEMTAKPVFVASAEDVSLRSCDGQSSVALRAS
jgi:hypothetical protein